MEVIRTLASTDAVHPGMRVRGSDHQPLGRVTRCWDDYFEVHRGIFYDHTWVVSLSDVASTSGRTVELIRPKEEVAEVLAGHVMTGREQPSRHAANEELQHWLDAPRR